MIPKTVLKSVLWRGSESARYYCIFQLLCFSLHPSKQWSDSGINPSKASCPIKTHTSPDNWTLVKEKKNREGKTRKTLEKRKWWRTNKQMETISSWRLDPFCERSDLKVHPVENQSEKDSILLTANHWFRNLLQAQNSGLAVARACSNEPFIRLSNNQFEAEFKW